VSVTHNLSAFVAHELSGLIITAEVIADGTNKVVTGDNDSWQNGRLTQAEAGRLLGISKSMAINGVD